MPRTTLTIAAVAALALTSCAHRAAKVAANDAAPPPPRPVLAAGYATVVPPPVDDAGRYRTINADTGEERTIWHVRAALNVAAIGCRGPENAALVQDYNALLGTRKAMLATANRTVEAEFRQAGGDWQDAHDRYMTRLYNFFSMPQAHVGFCAVAASVAPRAIATPPADWPVFAKTALMELEAPFLDVYRTVDEWKVASSAWDARYGPGAAPEIRTATREDRRADAPKLAYADVGRMLAWEPKHDRALAMR